VALLVLPGERGLLLVVTHFMALLGDQVLVGYQPQMLLFPVVLAPHRARIQLLETLLAPLVLAQVLRFLLRSTLLGVVVVVVVLRREQEQPLQLEAWEALGGLEFWVAVEEAVGLL